VSSADAPPAAVPATPAPRRAAPMAPTSMAFAGAAVPLCGSQRGARVAAAPCGWYRAARPATAAAAPRRRCRCLSMSADAPAASAAAAADGPIDVDAAAAPPTAADVAAEPEADLPTRLAAKRAALAANADKRAADEKWATDVAAKLEEINAALDAFDGGLSEEEREDLRIDVYMLKKTATDTVGVMAAGAADADALRAEIEALEAEVGAA